MTAAASARVRRSTFVWTDLALPAPLAPETAEAALTALAGLPGHPVVVLETLGIGGRVSWRLGCRRDVQSRVLGALTAHLGDLRPVPSNRQNRPSDDRVNAAAALRLRRGRWLPLDTDGRAVATRGLLAVMASTSRTETLRLQVVLGPRRSPALPRHDEQAEAAVRRRTAIKVGGRRFDCEIRLHATAATPDRARSLVSQAAGALRAHEAPGVRLRLARASVRSVERASSPLWWHLTLTVPELVGFTGWPIAAAKDAPLPGVPPRHPAAVPPHASIPPNPAAGRVLGDSPIVPGRALGIGWDDSLRHLHVIGPTGVGKSTLLANLALQDIAAGRGVVVIDPKRDLIRDLLARIPANRQDDVVVLDSTHARPVGVNPLGGTSNGSAAGAADLAADTTLAIFRSLYKDSWGPRTHDILHACLLTLARRGDASLVMVPLLLTNAGFRRSVVARASREDPLGLGSFWSWYESISDGERVQAIAPLMNKLRSVLLRPGLRAVFGQRAPSFHMEEVFTKNKILLVSLSKGQIGPEGAQLLGSIVMGLLWQTALAQTGRVPEKRAEVSVILDEFHDVLRLRGDLGDALAQARGLGVAFTLAHQHLAQLNPDIRSAVFANARSRVAFALSPEDASGVARLTADASNLEAADFAGLERYRAYTRLLTSGQTAPWCSLATRDLPVPTSDPRAIQERSATRYGQELDEVERDLLSLTEATESGTGAAATRVGRSRPNAASGGQS